MSADTLINRSGLRLHLICHSMYRWLFPQSCQELSRLDSPRPKLPVLDTTSNSALRSPILVLNPVLFLVLVPYPLYSSTLLSNLLLLSCLSFFFFNFDSLPLFDDQKLNLSLFFFYFSYLFLFLDICSP